MIRNTASTRLALPSVSEELRERLQHYFALLTTIRVSGRTEKEWLELKKQAQRSQFNANRMLETLDKLNRHRAITAGWISM